MKLSIVLASAAVSLVAAEGKVEVPFGNAWRFHYGDDPKGCGSGPGGCVFEKDVGGMTCTNMERNPNRFTPSDCHIACCYNPECMVWQQDGDRTCLHGGADAVCSQPASSHWIGGQRTASTPFQRDYTFKEVAYDASAWPVVSAPHDFIINQTFVNSTDNHHGYLPRNVSWYRKEFTLPEDFQGQTVYIFFDGVFHFTEIYVNGEHAMDHRCGYTQFTLRLDNITSVQYGPGAKNVISMRVDASYGSGHWYEGGGLYRQVRLVSVPQSHFVHGGVFVNPQSDGTYLKVSVEAENLQEGKSAQEEVTAVLYDDATGSVLAKNTTLLSLPLSGTATATFMLLPSPAMQLWSVRNPKTYRVLVSMAGDAVNVTTAARTVDWKQKLYLNNEEMQLRGFSHHNSFAGVGVAMPTRLALFRAQSQKALGGNFWRMSHNPYNNDLYEVLTHVGLMSWDENRDYGYEYKNEMADMVKYHRNHPTIMVWSFCNEFECNKWLSNDTHVAFRKAAKLYDPERAVAANMDSGSGPIAQGPTLSLDMVGFSHAGNNSFISYHQANPSTPLILSECCSCTTDREHNRGLSPDSCQDSQNSPGLLPYVSGSIGVWTLMDYFGESQHWPAVSCTFGQFDVAGFPKAYAWWYRNNWLAMVNQSSPSRPLVSGDTTVVRILNLLGDAYSPTTSFDCVASTSHAELIVDGASKGKIQVTDGTATWQVSTGGVKNATLLGWENGSVVGKHTVLMAGSVTEMELVIDVPSKATGTGEKLYLDGLDLAMVRVQLVDGSGRVAVGDARNVTFSVTGPAKVTGVGSGQTTNQQHNQGKTILTYGGLARVFVQPTVDCTSPEREMAASIDSLSGPVTYAATCPTEPIVLTAHCDGLSPASLTIPSSADFKDSPMEVAKASPDVDYSYITDIQA
eukprot:TRINITY_DN12287_c0_g1_i1.p1 TRINITY_DN12287_c0_g1~~TRINITY_DN12287_c0_g1_i1.p1  ORF type:complete len:928 (+),score=259.37 TRINITY_DN12287_c0_g1_i1:61-2784(+)